MHCASAALNMAISIDQYAQQNFANYNYNRYGTRHTCSSVMPTTITYMR